VRTFRQFYSALMQPILASFSTSISELKKNIIALLNQANGEGISILNHNQPTAYHVPTEKYELLMERLEDYDLGRIVKERQSEKAQAIEIELDDL